MLKEEGKFTMFLFNVKKTLFMANYGSMQVYYKNFDYLWHFNLNKYSQHLIVLNLVGLEINNTIYNLFKKYILLLL